jgi:endonuclease/exonuclease/phosphatase (EEP) superfamily protein YafD
MIDFILASPTMADAYVPKSYEVLLGSVDSCGSDHNPVVAAFTLTPRTARN